MLSMVFASTAVLAILAFCRIRWAYFAYIAVGLSYFPLRVDFQLNPRPCQWAVDVPLALHSLTNYPHIVLFALFFVITTRQLRTQTAPAFAVAGLVTLVMGALVEIAEAVTGRGNCRLRDLVPDAGGALCGMAILLLWHVTRPRLRVETSA